MDVFSQWEEIDGVRFSWNTFPSNRTDAHKLVVPISCVYSPLKERANNENEGDSAPIPPIPYDPVVCRAPCRGILNPYW